VSVVEDTTFHCAGKWVFSGEKTAVLNFANAYNLVLDAFGCGASNNPLEMVAKVFRNLPIEGGYVFYFKNVFFAIKKSGERCANLDAFRTVFSKDN